MRVPSNDPDMRRYDNQDEWITCSNCGYPMLPLKDYEIQRASESPSASAEAHEFYLMGWWAFVVNFFDDLFTLKSREARLAELKKEVLPQYPRSLVCPKCLELKRRP